MPTEKFQELFSLISHNTNFPILLVGSKKDEILCENIIERRYPEIPTKESKSIADRIFNLAGKTDLVELSYLISKAKVIVSNDSSPFTLLRLTISLPL